MAAGWRGCDAGGGADNSSWLRVFAARFAYCCRRCSGAGLAPGPTANRTDFCLRSGKGLRSVMATVLPLAGWGVKTVGEEGGPVFSRWRRILLIPSSEGILWAGSVSFGTALSATDLCGLHDITRVNIFGDLSGAATLALERPASRRSSCCDGLVSCFLRDHATVGIRCGHGNDSAIGRGRCQKIG